MCGAAIREIATWVRGSGSEVRSQPGARVRGARVRPGQVRSQPGCAVRGRVRSQPGWRGPAATWVRGPGSGPVATWVREAGRPTQCGSGNPHGLQRGGMMTARVDRSPRRPLAVACRGSGWRGVLARGRSFTPATAAPSRVRSSSRGRRCTAVRPLGAWARGDRGWVGYLRGYAVALPPSQLRGVALRPALVRRWPAARSCWTERCHGVRGAVRRAAVEAGGPGSALMTTRSLGPEARSADAHAGQRRGFCGSREGQA